MSPALDLELSVGAPEAQSGPERVVGSPASEGAATHAVPYDTLEFRGQSMDRPVQAPEGRRANHRVTPEQRPGELVVCDDGFARWKDKSYRCAWGRGGLVEDKHEGDGATPIGRFPLRQVLYRSDRLPRPSTELSVQAITPSDAWCEDPTDQNYNRLVRLDREAEADRLWREDHLYDVIVVVGYNDNPPVVGKGSAIFLHVAREEYSPTAGCIALSLGDLLEFLSTAGRDTAVRVSRGYGDQPIRSAKPMPSI